MIPDVLSTSAVGLSSVLQIDSVFLSAEVSVVPVSVLSSGSVLVISVSYQYHRLQYYQSETSTSLLVTIVPSGLVSVLPVPAPLSGSHSVPSLLGGSAPAFPVFLTGVSCSSGYSQ